MVHAISLYDTVLFVHILAVVVAFGVTFTYGLLDACARRAGIPDTARCTASRSSSRAG